jgi:hypothetical protein
MRRPEASAVLVGVASAAALAVLAWVVVAGWDPPNPDCITPAALKWHVRQSHHALAGLGVCCAAAALSFYAAAQNTGRTKRVFLVVAITWLVLGMFGLFASYVTSHWCDGQP